MRRSLLVAAFLLLVSAHLALAAKGPPVALVDQVVLVGIDGIDAATLDRLTASEDLPALAKLRAAGASGPLKTVTPALPPVAWTTIATGKDAKEHGVTGFAMRVPDVPAPRPFTSDAWKALPLWELLGPGRGVAVAGWPGTWPARDVNGVLVSDRLLPDRRTRWLEEHPAGAGLDRLTAPPELAPALLEAVAIDDAALATELAERFLDGARVAAATAELGDPVHELALAYRRDRGYLLALERVLDAREESPRLVALRLTGLEVALRAFPDDPSVARRYARWLDGRLSPWLDRASERVLVMVVSDHGHDPARRLDPADPGSLYGPTEPTGVVVLGGGPVKPGAKLRGARVQDITPTVLHLLGREVALDMDGTPMRVAVGPGGRGSIHYRRSYEGAAATPPPAPAPAAATAPARDDAAGSDNASDLGGQ